MGFTFSTLFSGGVDAAHQAFTPLRCRCVGGCEWIREARQLAFERTGLRFYADFNRLRMDDAARFVAEVLIGSAPCVTFSRAGKQRGTADPRGQLYFRQMDVVSWMAEKQRPLVLCFEMVTEVLHVENGAAQRELRRRMESAGYVPREHVLSSRDFGSVGQRVRLFTIGVRRDVYAAVGHVDKPTVAEGPRRRVKDVLVPLVLRPKTHVVDLAGCTIEWLPARDTYNYHGPILLGYVVGRDYQWRIYSTEGAAVTQRANGTNPTGLYLQDGVVVRLTARESARVMDVDDAVDIGERWGEEAAQHFAGNAISVFTLRAVGVQIKRLVARWRSSRGSPTSTVTGGNTSTGECAHSAGSSFSPGPRGTSDTTDDRNVDVDDVDLEDFRARHEDGCPIWCTARSCRVCDHFSHRAARRLDWELWLRGERRAAEAAVCEYVRDGRVREVDGGERELRRCAATTLARWRRRMIDPGAPLELVWWRWPKHHQEEARRGLAIGVVEPPPAVLMKNYASGEVPSVTEELDRFESAGFLEEGEITTVSPAAAVPKREAGAKDRVIIDLSKSGVNAAIATPPTVLPSVEDMLATLYAGGWMFETDFKDHFYHYKIRPEDRRHLGVRRPRGGGLRRFTRLPMGMASSPGLCSSRTCVWEEELLAHGPFAGEVEINIPGCDAYDPSMPMFYRVGADGQPVAVALVYVDDLFGLAPSRSKAMSALRTAVQRAGRFGFHLKYSKVKCPRQHSRTFHGFTVDTRVEHGGPKICVRPEVLRETTTMVDLALRSPRLVRRALARLVGKLLSIAPAVPHGVTFLRRLWDSLYGLHLPAERRPSYNDYDSEVAIDDEHRKDLVWWASALSESDGTYLLRDRAVRTRMHYTDGSGFGTGGCGYDLGKGAMPRVEFFAGLWRGEATSMTSNWKELRSILLALRRERQRGERTGTRPSLWRTRIYHATDNVVSESILLKGTSTSPKLQQLLREIAYEQRLMQCDLVPVHVAGKRLIAQGTDGLSRGQTHVGSMSGTTTNVDEFNPLTARPSAPAPPLAEWARQRWPDHRLLVQPDQWTAAHVCGKATLWMPPPMLARRAVTTFLRCRMMAPETTSAVFLLPRRHTAPWRRQLRHFASVTRVRAGEGAHWPESEFEPLVVAVCPRWVPQAKTNARSSTRPSPRSGARRPSARSADGPSATPSRSSASTGRTPSSRRTRSPPAPSSPASRSTTSTATRSRRRRGRPC